MKGRIFSALAMIPLAATLALAGADGECGGHGHDGPGHGDHGPGMHGGRHGRGEPGMRFRKHLDELNLTADQKKKVDAIFENAKKDREGNRGDLRGEYKKLHELLEQDKPDTKAVNAQVDKIGEMKTEQHKEMLMTLLAVRAELTPEQREKLKEMKKERRENWREKRRGKSEKSGSEEKPAPKAD